MSSGAGSTPIGEDATQVLTAASVLGVDFYEDVLLDMVGLPEPVRDRTLDAAARGGLLIDAGSVRRSLRFVHALVANALYSDVGSSRRARLHGLAAHALEKSVEELPPSVVVQLARQLCARRSSGRSATLVDSSRRSGARSPRTHRGSNITTASRSTSRSRSIGPQPSAPTCWFASEMRNTGPATRRRSPRSKKARDSRNAATRARRWYAPHSRPTAASCVSTTARRSTSPRSKRRSRSPTRLTLRRMRACAGCWREGLMYTPDAAGVWPRRTRPLDLATEHGDPTLLAQVAPAVLYALWGAGHRELRFARRGAGDSRRGKHR